MRPVKVRAFYPDYDDEHERVLRSFIRGIPGSQAIPIWSYSPPQEVDPFDCAVIYGDYKRAVERTKTKARVIRGQEDTKRDLIYLDSGYVNRGTYYSVGLNGMHGAGAKYHWNRPGDRFQALGITLNSLQYRPQGKIILAGQVPWDASVQDANHILWLAKTYKTLTEWFGEGQVVFRPHPRVVDLVYDIPDRAWSTQGTIQDALNDAAALVAFNSTSLVDAVLAGVPVLALGAGSIVQRASMGSFKDLAVWMADDLPDYRRVGFQQICNDMAYAQWTEDEMKTGKVWALLKDRIKVSDAFDRRLRKR